MDLVGDHEEEWRRGVRRLRKAETKRRETKSGWDRPPGRSQNGCWYAGVVWGVRGVSLRLCTCDLENLHTVMFGFRRNPDVARHGRSGGQKHIQLITIDYHTVAGTAGAECKGDRRSKRARRSESGTDSDSLTETQG